MKPNPIIIYSRSSNDSIVAKNKMKKKYPKAVIIESSNTEILKKALKGKGTVVHNLDSKLDLRKLKGEKVETNSKKKSPAKAKKEENKAPKNEVKSEKKPAKKENKSKK